MKSVIICEGATDLVLIQYFMEKVYSWTYVKQKDYRKLDSKTFDTITNANSIKWFQHNNKDVLCIIDSGGVSKIKGVLKSILDINYTLTTDSAFDKIVIITDRDEMGTEKDFIRDIKKVFSAFKVNFAGALSNNNWCNASYMNSIGNVKNVEFLPLIIPFEDTGAIETFLLGVLCEESEKSDPQQIDKHVIGQCTNFIDNIDCKGKYLKRRRDVTKAKFSTVFSVMTPVDAFVQRQTLLRGISWEKYETVQTGFKELGKLSGK